MIRMLLINVIMQILKKKCLTGQGKKVCHNMKKICIELVGEIFMKRVKVLAMAVDKAT